MFLAAEELAYSKPDLHRVDSGIQICEACVRNVHIAEFHAYVVFHAEDVHAQRSLVHEVYSVGVGGDALICEERTAGEFDVRREAAAANEVPLEAERVEAHA